MQRNVLQYLENSAKSFPGKIAFADEKNEITFSELKKCAMQVGTAISNKVEDINTPIAILVDRNVQSLIGFMGILYSGNYYVPIDKKMPQKRMESVFEQLNPSLILYGSKDSELLNDFSKYNLANIDSMYSLENGLAINEEELYRRINKVLDIDPVYIIFTSGTTGVPKGIVIPHKNVIDFTDWMASTCEINNDNVMGNQAPFYFDLSVKDIYLTLKCSATTYILSKKMLSFPIVLVDYLNEKKINTLIWATSAFHLVASSNVFSKKVPKYIKKVILGGEALLAKQLNIWVENVPDAQYINLYGPTEVTVDCTYYKINKRFKDYEKIPIGIPCENKEILLLDENLNRVKNGEIGEICVRGTGVARGYYNDKEKTNSAFIQNPLNPNYMDYIYKTGDLGRIGEDGLLYYESRKDDQVKHMGYRIELGEIERALNSFEKIKIAVCVYSSEDDKIICAYDGDTGEDEIINHIKEMVPKYMYPNTFKKLESIPYSSNGKVDRKKIREYLGL